MRPWPTGGGGLSRHRGKKIITRRLNGLDLANPLAPHGHTSRPTAVICSSCKTCHTNWNTGKESAILNSNQKFGNSLSLIPRLVKFHSHGQVFSFSPADARLFLVLRMVSLYGAHCNNTPGTLPVRRT